MQHVYTIINQIALLSIIGILGFIAGRKKYLPENTGIVVSRLIVKVTAPLLVLTTMTRYKFSHKMLMDGALVFGLGVVFLTMTYFLGTLATKIFGIKGATANVFKMHSMFGNVVFLAYPLIDAMFPEKGLIYAVFYSIANDTMFWTVGIYLVNSHNTTSWKDNLRQLINANTIAFALGFLCMLFNIQQYVESSWIVGRVYNALYDSLNPLGKTTIYLSMIFIGLILSEVRLKGFKDIAGRLPVLALALLKLVVTPSIAILILSVVGGGIDPFIKTILVLQLAMPCGTLVAALAAQYDSDYRFASESVFFSTIMGMFTLPFLVYIVEIIKVW